MYLCKEDDKRTSEFYHIIEKDNKRWNLVSEGVDLENNIVHTCPDCRTLTATKIIKNQILYPNGV